MNTDNIFNPTLTVEERVLKAVITLQKRAPFFSYIVMNMRVKQAASDEMGTAAINRYGDLWYSKAWMEKQSDPQILFTLAHEASHVSTLTFDRLGPRDFMLWNIATDLVINDMLQQDGFVAPAGIYMADPDGNWEHSFDDVKVKINVRKSTAEEVYEQLEKYGKKLRDKLGDLFVTFGDGGSPGENGEKSGKVKGFLDNHIYDGKKVNPNDEETGDTPTDRKANAEKWKRNAAAAQTASKMRGVTSSIMSREMPNVMNPKLDWRTMLQRFITSRLPTDLTMRLPGRRSQVLGYYMPSTLKESLNVIVGPDVSGSIGAEEYAEMMSETLGILNGYPQIKTTIIPWATSVLPEDVITVSRSEIQTLLTYRPKNSGGTTFSCLKEYIEENAIQADVCVAFTDGFTEGKPQIPNCPTIVVITKAGTDKNFLDTEATVCSLRDVDV